MTDTNTETYLYKGETTNGCTCTAFDEKIADWIPAETCYGYCWDDQTDEFHNSIVEFMQGNPTHDFLITGFPVWCGDVSGRFEARNSMEFLSAVTVRGDWTLRWEVTPEAFTAVLSHHDGTGRITVVPAPEEVF